MSLHNVRTLSHLVSYVWSSIQGKTFSLHLGYRLGNISRMLHALPEGIRWVLLSLAVWMVIGAGVD